MFESRLQEGVKVPYGRSSREVKRQVLRGCSIRKPLANGSGFLIMDRRYGQDNI